MSNSKFVKSTFNKDWTNPTIFPEFSKWIKEVPKNSFLAHCTLCKKNFSLSNMGRKAVTSHAQSGKHKSLSSYEVSSGIINFLSPKNESLIPVETTEEATNQAGSMSCFVLKENTLKAEITWALKLVMSHSSFNAFNDAADIFLNMFSDSEIVKKCTLGRAKMSYVVCYGLAPFFHRSLQHSLNNKAYVICFDEALNRISQKCQMDLIIRYWCDSTNRVASRYWTSVFLGRTTAEDLFSNFKDALENLDVKLLLQIGMDGPNVNMSFLKHVNKEMLSQNDCEILELGTCGLHIIHGAFQAGHKSTKWKLDGVLRSIYALFKNSPARRAIFIEITGSKEFPLKFCAVRWVENVKVCERALKVFDNIKKYIEASIETLPKTFTCDFVIKACRDKLILAKICFFSYIASGIEPFLKKFQTSEPMVPFLYENICSLIRQLMRKIVKADVVEAAKTLDDLISIDLDNANNLLLRRKVDIGIVSLQYLNKSGATEAQRLEFLNQCFSFIKVMLKKIFERFSKSFGFLRAASSLSPKLLRNNLPICENRMNNLLQLLYSKGKILPGVADRAKYQFQVFINKIKNELNEEFSAYNEDLRLDDFYSSLMQSDKDLEDIWEVTKIVLTLSHGNASVESGFSVNKDMLVENLNEDSLIGLRTVYDAVKTYGGITNVPLTKDLLQSVKCARSRYHQALEEKKKKEEKDEKEESLKRKISEQVKLLQKRKKKIMDEKSLEIADIDEQIIELKKKH